MCYAMRHAVLAGYGPVDQGAFNQYYEAEIKGKPINKVKGVGVSLALVCCVLSRCSSTPCPCG